MLHSNRDPKRIPIIIEKLKWAWELVPEWRFGQLVNNLLGPGPHDVFHPQDETWERLLEEFIKEHTK
jgi:hypothetical protein